MDKPGSTCGGKKKMTKKVVAKKTMKKRVRKTKNGGAYSADPATGIAGMPIYKGVASSAPLVVPGSGASTHQSGAGVTYGFEGDVIPGRGIVNVGLNRQAGVSGGSTKGRSRAGKRHVGKTALW